MASSVEGIVRAVGQHYVKNTPKRVQLVDAYLLYVVLTGVLQMLYCALVGTFPFNSFLAGFFSSVSCFVLGMTLRLQLTDAARFSQVSPERAFVEFVFCNLVLHFVVFTFMG